MNDEMRKKIEPLMDIANAVNKGEVQSVVNMVGGVIAVNSCPLCHGKIQIILRSLPWQVGSCPHCNKILFFINVPFHACGNIGPPCAAIDCEFYYNTNHLGDYFVEILEADNE